MVTVRYLTKLRAALIHSAQRHAYGRAVARNIRNDSPSPRLDAANYFFQLGYRVRTTIYGPRLIHPGRNTQWRRNTRRIRRRLN